MDGRIGWMDGLIEMPGETAKILRRHVSSSHTHTDTDCITAVYVSDWAGVGGQGTAGRLGGGVCV